MLGLPEARLAEGVKVAVRVAPVPLRVPSVPPIVVMSAAVKPLGGSLKVKVIAAVSPAFTAATSLVIDSVGLSVSTVTDRVPAMLIFPAVSVANALNVVPASVGI